jgi:CRP-like cAMP-binding protein
MSLRSASAEHAEHLAKVPLFAGLSKKDLAKIAKASEEVEIAAGRTLVDQGRPGHEFYLILEGTAVVRRNNRKVAELGPGQYFGELAILDRGPRSASVVANTDMRVLVLSQRSFVGVLESLPGMAYKILTVMAQRLREADTRALGH